MGSGLAHLAEVRDDQRQRPQRNHSRYRTSHQNRSDNPAFHGTSSRELLPVSLILPARLPPTPTGHTIVLAVAYLWRLKTGKDCKSLQGCNNALLIHCLRNRKRPVFFRAGRPGTRCPKSTRNATKRSGTARRRENPARSEPFSHFCRIEYCTDRVFYYSNRSPNAGTCSGWGPSNRPHRLVA